MRKIQIAVFYFFLILLGTSATVSARDNGLQFNPAPYVNRPTLPDFTVCPKPDNPQSLTQV